MFCGGVAARALGARAANSFGRLTLPQQPVCHHRPDTPEAPNCPYVVAHRLADMCTSPSRSADGSALRRTHVITHIARAHACATYAVRRRPTRTHTHTSVATRRTQPHTSHTGAQRTHPRATHLPHRPHTRVTHTARPRERNDFLRCDCSQSMTCPRSKHARATEHVAIRRASESVYHASCIVAACADCSAHEVAGSTPRLGHVKRCR